MKSHIRTLIAIAMLIVSSLVITGAASANNGGLYIQINNGQIVTNPGQRFQVVAQFGNQGQTPLTNVFVMCFMPSSLGTFGNIYSPFAFTDTYTNAQASGAGGGTDIADINNGIVYFYIVTPITLNPGQNYNFSVDVNVTAPAGTESYVNCFTSSNIGTPQHVRRDTATSVRVQ